MRPTEHRDLRKLIAGSLAVAALAVSLQSCGSETSSPEAQDVSRGYTEADVPNPDYNLPIRAVNADEVGPTDVKAAVEASDVVVLGTVVKVEGGVRYFNGGSESLEAELYEAVNFSVDVQRWVKRPEGASDVVKFSATAFVVKPESRERIARISINGAQYPLRLGARYLLFLKEFSEPFGWAPVSASGALMEIDADEIISGTVSSLYQPLIGTPLDKVLP